ncbi:UNKNOWN [Stylonychia lemnae]|uniref:EF-hand domain-containing protein n=1 Tax=Stylonychia lemnae TaxID=5949 RepID=A0A078AWQ0_STYLE|nr:UNKNOWN [Stylonychia lemnae]|eukprot:CDW86589.1 UNKNOWN [Stylonychia lemnae]
MFEDQKLIQEGVLRDKDFDSLCAKNYLDPIKGTKSTYRLYSSEGIIYFATAALEFDWAYKQQTEFWNLNQISNNLFGKKVYRCQGVWWFAPKWIMQKIPPGVYHVYIRHGNSNVGPVCRFIHYKGIGSEEKFGEVPLSNAQIPFQKNFNKLIATYAATLDLSDAEELTNIEIMLFREAQQVQDYLVEGSILVPVQSLDKLPSYYLKLQMDDEILDIDWKLPVQQIELVIPKFDQESDDDFDKPALSKSEEQFKDINFKEFDKDVVEKIKNVFIELWNYYDVNKNGYLDKQEFKNFMRNVFQKIQYPVDEIQIENYFERSDTDSTGQVTKFQLEWLLKQVIRIQVQLQDQQEAQNEIRKLELELKAQNQSAKDLEKKYEDGDINIEGTISILIEGEILQIEDFPVQNLIQKEGKWRIEGSNEATIIINFEEEIEFNVVGIKSADDCPEMDPVIIEIQLMKDLNYEEVVKKDNLMFDERFQNRLFEVNEFGVKAKGLWIYLKSGSDKGLQLSQIKVVKSVGLIK